MNSCISSDCCDFDGFQSHLCQILRMGRSKNKVLFEDEDASTNTETGMSINKEFAKKYQVAKQKQELAQRTLVLAPCRVKISNYPST